MGKRERRTRREKRVCLSLKTIDHDSPNFLHLSPPILSCPRERERERKREIDRHPPRRPSVQGEKQIKVGNH